MSAGHYFSQESGHHRGPGPHGTYIDRPGRSWHGSCSGFSARLGRRGGAVATGRVFRKRLPNDVGAPALPAPALSYALPSEFPSRRSTGLRCSPASRDHQRRAQRFRIGWAWRSPSPQTCCESRCRIEQADHEAVPDSDIDGGWNRTVVGELATRWGIDRQSGGKTVWIEYDLDSSTDPEIMRISEPVSRSDGDGQRVRHDCHTNERSPPGRWLKRAKAMRLQIE